MVKPEKFCNLHLVYHFTVPLNGAIIHLEVHHDVRHIVEWLRANKISVNSEKTEPILFRSKNKNITNI